MTTRKVDSQETLDADGLRARRRALGLTQAQLATHLRVTSTTVARWERGERPISSPGSVLLALQHLATTHRVAPQAVAPQTSADDQPIGRLPSPISSFVGREREISEVTRLLGTNRLVTLTGPGGVGKTRLALRVAELIASGFADGVIFVPLADIRDPGLIGLSIARACTQSDVDDASITRTLQRLLDTKQLLLVLDNFEHVLSAGPLVSSVLTACASLRMLITSRAPLHLNGEHVYPVPPLELPHASVPALGDRSSDYSAIKLFVERARAACGSFLLDDQSSLAVEAICRRLDGLPLAIELAALRLRSLPAPVLLAQLEQSLHVLVDGARDLPLRHQTLRSTIAWSYDLLDGQSQSVLRSLSVFAGGFGLRAATIVSHASDAEALQSLTLLLQHGLVQTTAQTTDEPRYRVLETIREYAAEQLAQAGEQPGARDRHANFFIELVEQVAVETNGPRAGQSLDLLSTEHDNLRNALAWYLDSGQIDAGLRLASALHNFWIFRGHIAEGDRWLCRLLDAAAEPSAARARALALACTTAYTLGDHDRARTLGSAAIQLGLQTGDTAACADAHWHLGVAARERGDYTEARQHLAAAVAAARECGDRVLAANALFEIAFLTTFEGRLAEALELAKEVHTIQTALGSLRGQAMVEGLHGRVQFLRGDFAAARRHVRRALHLSALAGESGASRASFLAMLARIETRDGRLTRARGVVHACLTAASQAQSMTIIPRAMDAAACLAAAEGRHEDAIRNAAAGSAIRRAFGLHSPANLTQMTEAELAGARRRVGPQRARRVAAEGESLTWDAAVAHALAQCAARPPARGSRLTPREQDVAELIAEGLSNAEIGCRLIITERTVENHVAHILDKLDVRSRIEIATWIVADRVRNQRAEPRD